MSRSTLFFIIVSHKLFEKIQDGDFIWPKKQDEVGGGRSRPRARVWKRGNG